MCIAIYKPKGAKIPYKKILKTCFKNNPDGAGYLQIKGDTCHIKKGFMTFKSFWKAFSKEKFTENSKLGIHFRIGTSGELTKEFTHPFPIANKVDELRKTHITWKRALLHNGIIGEGEKNLSDTMLFVMNVLYPLAPYFEDEGVISAIENITKGNRLMIVDFGEVYLTGKWVEKDGVLYSNDSYKERVSVSAKNWKRDIYPLKYGADNTQSLLFDDEFDDDEFDDKFDLDDYEYKADLTETEKGVHCPLCDSFVDTVWRDEGYCEECNTTFDINGG